ncbi:MAG: ornithine carbamoyltransferase, partial [Puniceicoccales bacterium]
VFVQDPQEAIRGADAVYTDVWVSMGDEEEAAKRLEAMAPYSVTSDLMKSANPDCIFLHCMPAHPGEEVTQEVLSSDQSVLFDQAENRLHMQKAILAQLGEWAKTE